MLPFFFFLQNFNRSFGKTDLLNGTVFLTFIQVFLYFCKYFQFCEKYKLGII